MFRLIAPLLLLLAVATACSSSDPAPADAGVSNASDAGGRCSAEPTAKACAECCGYTQAVAEAYTRPYEACACKEVCKDRCATSVCASPRVTATPDCDDCLALDALIACSAEANDACQADPACKAYTACETDALCAGRQGSADGGT